MEAIKNRAAQTHNKEAQRELRIVKILFAARDRGIRIWYMNGSFALAQLVKVCWNTLGSEWATDVLTVQEVGFTITLRETVRLIEHGYAYAWLDRTGDLQQLVLLTRAGEALAATGKA